MRLTAFLTRTPGKMSVPITLFCTVLEIFNIIVREAKRKDGQTGKEKVKLHPETS